MCYQATIVDVNLCCRRFCAEIHNKGRPEAGNILIRIFLQGRIHKKNRLLYRKRVYVHVLEKFPAPDSSGMSRVRADTCPMYVQLHIPCLNRLLSGSDNPSAEVYTLSATTFHGRGSTAIIKEEMAPSCHLFFYYLILSSPSVKPE